MSFVAHVASALNTECINCFECSERGSRTVKLDHTFFTGYRRNVVLPDEVLVSIDVPFTEPVRWQVQLTAK